MEHSEIIKTAAHVYSDRAKDGTSIEEAFMAGARWAFAFQDKPNWKCGVFAKKHLEANAQK